MMSVVSTRDPGVAADALRVLGNERRLVALRVLVEDGGCSMRELSNRVAAVMHDTRVGRVDASDRKAVYVALYQHHVPKLEEAGFIERDRDEITAKPWTAEVLESVTELVDELPVSDEVPA